MAIMALIGPWLLTHLFGSEFSSFSNLVWPMAALQVANAMGVSFTLLLLSEKRGAASLVVGTVASVATMVFATILAIEYAAAGAAWGMAAASGVASAAAIYFALRKSSSLSEERARSPV
jgi:O-antigen/teichoic acid export membrane protein